MEIRKNGGNKTEMKGIKYIKGRTINTEDKPKKKKKS